jgi:DNA-binding transcriptional ArsR family regulator
MTGPYRKAVRENGGGLRGPMNEQDATEKVLVALRHPVRRQILVWVVQQSRPVSPRDLAEQLRMPLSNASYHARVLAQCDVLKLVDLSPKRGPIQHFYEPGELVEHPMVKAALEPGDDDGTSTLT